MKKRKNPNQERLAGFKIYITLVALVSLIAITLKGRKLQIFVTIQIYEFLLSKILRDFEESN